MCYKKNIIQIYEPKSNQQIKKKSFVHKILFIQNSQFLLFFLSIS